APLVVLAVGVDACLERLAEGGGGGGEAARGSSGGAGAGASPRAAAAAKLREAAAAPFSSWDTQSLSRSVMRRFTEACVVAAAIARAGVVARRVSEASGLLSHALLLLLAYALEQWAAAGALSGGTAAGSSAAAAAPPLRHLARALSQC